MWCQETLARDLQAIDNSTLAVAHKARLAALLSQDTENMARDSSGRSESLVALMQKVVIDYKKKVSIEEALVDPLKKVYC